MKARVLRPVLVVPETKHADDLHRIATERVKWSRKYQQKYGITTRAARLPDDAAVDGLVTPSLREPPRSRPRRLLLRIRRASARKPAALC